MTSRLTALQRPPMIPYDQRVHLFRAAIEGNCDAAFELLATAVHAAELLEYLFERKPALVADVSRIGALHGFPILWSWHKQKNQRRTRMVEFLQIGSLMPFRTTGVHFDKTHDQIRSLITLVMFESSAAQRRLKPLTKANAHFWAKKMADIALTRLPANSIVALSPLPGNERAMQAVAKRKRVKVKSMEKAYGKWTQEAFEQLAAEDFLKASRWHARRKKVEATKVTKAEIRNAFVEEVTKRLERLLKN